MVPKAAEVVIVGAGAVGCSIAYHLTKRGQRDVVVLERDTIGAGSTSKAAGGIRAQFATEIEIRFSLESIDFFRRFKDEMGAECGYAQEGYLFIVTDQPTLAKFQANVRLQNELGVPSRIIRPDEVRELAPGVTVDDVIAGVWCPIDGHASPNDVCMAFAARAREGGARFLEETEVVAMRKSPRHTTIVETSSGTIETPLVINAAGPSAAPVARMLGVDVPVTPRRRHIFVTDELNEVRHPLPLVIDTKTGFYVRSELRTLLMSPGDSDPVSDYRAVPVDWRALELAVERGVPRLPVLEQARARSAWAGLRPLTPDEHAIVDWLPGTEGVFCAVGFCGHGFQHAPATGRYVAEWLLDGRASVDLDPLSFARFTDQPAGASAGAGLSGTG